MLRLKDILSTLSEADSPTERTRRYNRRHPEKVKQYLRKTVDDRVARNKDRKKAVAKYGEAKMKNHDVHHPNGPSKGNWRLAKKDHGPDKKESVDGKEIERDKQSLGYYAQQPEFSHLMAGSKNKKG